MQSLVAILGPGAALLLLSTLSGVLLVCAFRYLSFQGAIARIKGRIGATLLESVVFRRETLISLKAQGRTFLGGLAYLGITLPSFLVLGLPCVYLLSQMFPHLGVQPLPPGPALLTITTEDSATLFKLKVQTGEVHALPPVRVESENQSWYRVALPGAGSFPVQISLDGESRTIPIVAGSGVADAGAGPVYPEILSGFWERLLFPSPYDLPPRVTALSIRYPERVYRFLGIEWNWVVVFFLVSLISGYAAAKIFKIQI